MPKKLKLKTLLYSKHYREYTIRKLAHAINYKISISSYMKLPGWNSIDKAEKLKAKWNTVSRQQN